MRWHTRPGAHVRVCAHVCVRAPVHAQDPAQAAWRAAADDRLARLLASRGLRPFVAHWYAQPLWASLRRHPRFGALAEARARGREGGAGAAGLAGALAAMSTGRMVRRGGGGGGCASGGEGGGALRVPGAAD